ncbi:hypothetical protein AAMO2058_000328000 [Amorphochlora amoebiformis]
MADPTAPTEPLDSADAVREFVHGIQAPKESEEKDFLVEQARSMKDAGNKAFRAGEEQYDEALKIYTQALELSKSDPKLTSTLRANRALLYLHQKKYDLALADAKISLQNNLGNGKAYIRAGQACERTGRPNMACAYYNLTLERADNKKSKAFAAKLLKRFVERTAQVVSENKSVSRKAVRVTQAQMVGAGSETRVDQQGKARDVLLSSHELKERKRKFDLIVKRYSLNYAEPQEAIADYLTSLNGKLASADDFIKKFPMMSKQEAIDFLSWIQTGIQFKEQVLDKNKRGFNQS